MAYVSLKFLLWFYKEGASKRKIAIVILNKVKNLNTPTSAFQILRFALDDMKF